MSKRAVVMVDFGCLQTVVADDWIVYGGSLTLRLNGEPVADFNRWFCVKWEEEITGSSNRTESLEDQVADLRKGEGDPLVDLIGESATQ